MQLFLDFTRKQDSTVLSGNFSWIASCSFSFLTISLTSHFDHCQRNCPFFSYFAHLFPPVSSHQCILFIWYGFPIPFHIGDIGRLRLGRRPQNCARLARFIFRAGPWSNFWVIWFSRIGSCTWKTGSNHALYFPRHPLSRTQVPWNRDSDCVPRLSCNFSVFYGWFISLPWIWWPHSQPSNAMGAHHWPNSWNQWCAALESHICPSARARYSSRWRREQVHHRSHWHLPFHNQARRLVFHHEKGAVWG